MAAMVQWDPMARPGKTQEMRRRLSNKWIALVNPRQLDLQVLMDHQVPGAHQETKDFLHVCIVNGFETFQASIGYFQHLAKQDHQVHQAHQVPVVRAGIRVVKVLKAMTELWDKAMVLSDLQAALGVQVFIQ